MIEVVPETGSTNADLAARIGSGQPVGEAHWLIADRQTAGRGRRGRQWFDGTGNFMGSTVVALRPTDPEPASLALLAGLAVREAVAGLLPPDSPLSLKWPNDVLHAGAKICGILLERVGNHVIIGIGVNVRSAPQVPDRHTVALADLGVKIGRDAFADMLAASFASELERWRTFGLPPMLRRWEAVGHPAGTLLAIVGVAETPLLGEFAGLADDGALQLRLADGTTRMIHAGEVTFARPQP